MRGNFVRNTITGFCVFAMVTIILYIAAVYAAKLSAQKPTALPEETAVAEAANFLTENEMADCDFYMARFDGKGIAIFACSDKGEEFLYTIDIRPTDISDAELTTLKNGVLLESKEALASFEEDFS